MYYGSPPIVTNGLVLALDAGNTKSYTSGSTNWFSLGKPTLSGSLTNVGFDAYKGCLLFASSSNSTCIFNNSDLLNFNTGSFSIEVVVKLTATASGTVNALWQKRSSTSGLGSIPGYQYRILNSTTTVASTLLSVDNGKGGNDYTIINSNPSFPYFNIIHSVVIFNYSSLKLSEYRNGVLVTPESNNSSTGIMTGSFYNNNLNFRLGKNEGNSLDAEYYVLRAYNRVLSQQEITQNYNAGKTRFGLA